MLEVECSYCAWCIDEALFARRAEREHQANKEVEAERAVGERVAEREAFVKARG